MEWNFRWAESHTHAKPLSFTLSLSLSLYLLHSMYIPIWSSSLAVLWTAWARDTSAIVRASRGNPKLCQLCEVLMLNNGESILESATRAGKWCWLGFVVSQGKLGVTQTTPTKYWSNHWHNKLSTLLFRQLGRFCQKLVQPQSFSYWLY